VRQVGLVLEQADQMGPAVQQAGLDLLVEAAQMVPLVRQVGLVLEQADQMGPAVQQAGLDLLVEAAQMVPLVLQVGLVPEQAQMAHPAPLAEWGPEQDQMAHPAPLAEWGPEQDQMAHPVPLAEWGPEQDQMAPPAPLAEWGPEQADALLGVAALKTEQVLSSEGPLDLKAVVVQLEAPVLWHARDLDAVYLVLNDPARNSVLPDRFEVTANNLARWQQGMQLVLFAKGPQVAPCQCVVEEAIVPGQLVMDCQDFAHQD